ncbi:hypothetical protein K1719_021484 [Acacia pycnantha]|nr:hypothetical protein K1719_021484 [Acacia pycnantha]
MHDMIRDMALWLLPQDHDNMELVKRILITNDWESQRSIDLANVTTLVLLEGIHYQLEDIKYMERLKVLELRVSVVAFVDIGDLISLEKTKFFINLKSLTNLKFLSIQYMSFGFMDWEIPLGVLSTLQQLRVFRLRDVMISRLEERRILEELECLPNIEDLQISIRTSDGLDKLSESTKLQSCLYYFSADGYNYAQKPLLSLRSMSGLKKLQHIFLGGLNIISDLYPFMVETCWLAKLRRVGINSCQVTHVTWLKYAPLLQQLLIYGCESMEEVIKEEEAIKDENVDVFSSLVELILIELPILKSIHRAPLPFPSLKSVVIESCPKLEPSTTSNQSSKIMTIKSLQIDSLMGLSMFLSSAFLIV